jgi:uncharacterized protein YxeA
MKKGIIIAIAAVVIVGTGAYLLMHKKDSNNPTPSNNANDSSKALSDMSMSPSFTITAKDDSADHEMIAVEKDAKVKLTFNVSSEGVYHGGLQFKSTDPQIDSGPIAPGKSKTVTFTATKSFSFQPYWYASGVKKNYLITVEVQ